MINTYNESSLHKTIKTLYAQEVNGTTEVALNGHIYDIVAGKQIIEIQTGNLAKLLPKVLDSIEKGYKVKVVFPLVINKWIESTNEANNKVSLRRSPKKQSIYNIFDELTGLYPVLLNKKFKLDVVCINILEKRSIFEEPVQTLNKSRRFKKNWIKTGKELKEIISTQTFSKKEDYLNLIPKDVLPEFCAKSISQSLKKNKELPSSAAQKSHIMIWVLKHMDLLKETQIKNRSHYYTIK
ncbi:MAG: hypothetical protein MJ182_07850 [Treponema sp.]|nr:hypothetical protein [Treponema sp.]